MVDQPEPDDRPDTDAALARAEEVRRHAGHLTSVMAADERWWQGVERRNSFRARWAAVTGRAQ